MRINYTKVIMGKLTQKENQCIQQQKQNVYVYITSDSYIYSMLLTFPTKGQSKNENKVKNS